MAINRSNLPRNHSKKIWSIGLALSALSMTFAFQNCSQPPSEGAGLSSMKMEDEQAKNVPFAYDTTIDQIGYMSCSYLKPNEYDKSAYFTFRAGAYRQAGLKVKDEYFNTYSTAKNSEALAELLTASRANNATAVQLAVRGRGNLQNILTSTGAPVPDNDYFNMLVPLGTYEMSSTLVSNGFLEDIKAVTGKRMKHVRTGQVTGARLEGDLHFTSSWDLSNQLRESMRNDSLLTVTYTEDPAKTGSPFSARTPKSVWPENAGPSPTGYVYGRGYQVSFGRPTVPSLHTNYPANVMTTVSEQNLLDPADRSDIGTWTCPWSAQFMIVLPEDAAPVGTTTGAGCRRIPDPDPSDPTKFTFQHQIIRNTLKFEDWWIDYERRCIIPKKSSVRCYGAEKYVEYDLTKDCTPNATNTRLNYKTCASFASVCHRTN